MEDAVKNQRAIIFFLWKEGSSGSNITQRLKDVFGESALNKTAVYKWLQRFNTGRESLEDDPRSGRPSTSVTAENVETVEELIEKDRRVTIHEIACSTGIAATQVHEIIHRHLHMSKLTARWIPRLLTETQKNARMEACQELLRISNELGESFWSRIITTDETWLPFFMPETKEQSKQWCRKEDRPPLKAKTVSSSKKVMITVFWDCDGIILIDYLESGRTINSEYYSNLLRNDLRNALKNKRRGKLSSIPLIQQDNARPHTAARTVDTIRQMGWILLPHPPYSPDLAPSDFHLFSALKKPLRGKHFADEEDMKRAVTQWVRKTPRDFFSDGIRRLSNRWRKCLSLKGEYVEKYANDEDNDSDIDCDDDSDTE